MPNVTIHLTTVADTEEILHFELENREFFESKIPPRHPDYYSLPNLRQIMAEIVSEQEQGLLYMYLLRNSEGELVGRINLFSIARGIFETAELGYRIGEKHTGKGYATAGVRHVMKEAFKNHKLHRIEAATSPENIGSQIVLLKNNFQFIGRARQVIHVHGKWSDSIIFDQINDQFEK